MLATALAFAPVPVQAQAGAHEQRPDRVMVRFRADATTSSRNQAIAGIGGTSAQRDTLRSLGLKRIGDTVVKEDRPEIRGMVASVTHLVAVEEVD